MAQADLQVSLRETVGKGVARRLRAEGLVPGVVYGKGIETCPLTVNPKTLMKALDTSSGLNTLLVLKGAGPVDGQVVILKDYEKHPIKGSLTHVDFQTIDMAQKVYANVPIVATGTAAGVKEGGTLQMVRHELEVYCLPNVIPDVFEVDVTNLNIGDTIHVEEIEVPPGIEVPHEVNFTILTIAGQAEEEDLDAEDVEDVEGVVEEEPETGNE